MSIHRREFMSGTIHSVASLSREVTGLLFYYMDKMYLWDSSKWLTLSTILYSINLSCCIILSSVNNTGHKMYLLISSEQLYYLNAVRTCSLKSHVLEGWCMRITSLWTYKQTLILLYRVPRTNQSVILPKFILGKTNPFLRFIYIAWVKKCHGQKMGSPKAAAPTVLFISRMNDGSLHGHRWYDGFSENGPQWLICLILGP